MSSHAIQRLKEGNARFVAGNRDPAHAHLAARRLELTQRQEPFAIILGCSDARVPAEMIFDQGLGDLFVIRVAGGIVAPSQLGSIEFAVERFGTRVVVVLGHSGCGAVDATLDSFGRHSEPSASANVASIVARIRPSVAPVIKANPAAERNVLLAAAVRANVAASVNQIRHGTAFLERLAIDEKLRIVGAEYDLASGQVEFLDI